MSMRPAYIIGSLLLLQTAGCSMIPPAPPPAEAVVVIPDTAPPMAPAPTPGTTAPAAAIPPDPVMAPPAPVALPAPAPAVAAAPPNEKAGADQRTAAVTPKPAAAPRSIAPPSAPSPPPLALATLEQRLKDTSAIGVFTKITLKNQVDELLERFRAHYEGRGGNSLAQLRQHYDQLLQKAHSLLKDGDPGLAQAILNSRESIWAVLTDPVRFAKL